MVIAELGLRCFLSHKCNDEAHDLAVPLETALRPHGVALLRDPFETGHVIVTRIRSLTFHSFVFLHCPDSWASPMCQEELETARDRGVPILTVRLASTVPSELKDRVYADLGRPDVDRPAALQALAMVISSRSRLHHTITMLDPCHDPEETRKTAQRLVSEFDATLIAEYVTRIASYYRPETDVAARFWLAIALGKAGTPEAKKTLDSFSWEDHPYPREGIKEAHAMLDHGIKRTR